MTEAMTVKIGDELRACASTAWLNHMADRIDLEMIELPKDADGKPIHVGDTVWGCRSGMKMTVGDIRMTTNGWFISTSRGYLTDAAVTRTRPDSLESIADEIEESLGTVFIDDSILCGWADRIRKLAANWRDHGRHGRQHWQERKRCPLGNRKSGCRTA